VHVRSQRVEFGRLAVSVSVVLRTLTAGFRIAVIHKDGNIVVSLTGHLVHR
jgi:hypothetical protein